MLYFATLSDYNYIQFGLSLFESILENCSDDFVLYYLAIDDKTYQKLKKINDPRLKPYSLDDIKNSEEYKKIEGHNKYKPKDLCYYCFSLGSFFTDFIAKIEEPPHIFYIDSDIYFYQDPVLLFNSVKNHSIGLCLHKHTKFGDHVGYYNVSIVYFANDKIGFDCLNWWKNLVSNPNNKWKKSHGQVGDQKYLELFHKFYKQENIKEIDYDIGHIAPWSFNHVKLKGNRMEWKGKDLPFVFYHFSHFMPDYKNNKYDTKRKREWNPEVCPGARELYDNYFEKTKEIIKKYEL